MLIGSFVYAVFVQPASDFDLAIGFSRLKNKICHAEGLLSGSEGLDGQYEKLIDIKFYIYWFLHKRFLKILACPCFDKRPSDDSDVTYEQMTNYFEEQKNQVDFLLSLKYAAQ